MASTRFTTGSMVSKSAGPLGVHQAVRYRRLAFSLFPPPLFSLPRSLVCRPSPPPCTFASGRASGGAKNIVKYRSKSTSGASRAGVVTSRWTLTRILQCLFAPGGAWAPRWPQDGPKMAPRWPKMAPRRLQDGPRRLQDEPGRLQDGPRWPQDGPRWRQDGPRWPQDGFKMVPRSLKMCQCGSKMAQDGPKCCQRCTWNTTFGA